MTVDNGVRITRFSAATPSVSTDDALREGRIDGGGRLYVRNADDRDLSPRYFRDGEAVDAVPANDRGMVILGKEDGADVYRIFRIDDQGCLCVSLESGTDATEHSDAEDGPFAVGDTNGSIALTKDDWILVKTIAVAAGKYHVDGWTAGSDRIGIAQICLADDTGADGVDRADVTEVIDTQYLSDGRPSDHFSFQKPIPKSGGTNINIAIFIKQLQSAASGEGWGMVNGHTTT